MAAAMMDSSGCSCRRSSLVTRSNALSQRRCAPHSAIADRKPSFVGPRPSSMNKETSVGYAQPWKAVDRLYAATCPLSTCPTCFELVAHTKQLLPCNKHWHLGSCPLDAVFWRYPHSRLLQGTVSPATSRNLVLAPLLCVTFVREARRPRQMP